MKTTRWDALVLARAITGAVLALGLVALITAATDEGGIRWAERAGRALPLSPICAAIGVWGALGPVKARGEALALEALGRTRKQIAAAAVCGAALVCTASSVVIAAARSVDVAGFYPTASHVMPWEWRGSEFVDPVHGVRVRADGTPSAARIEAVEAPRLSVPAHGRIAAALASAMAGLAMSLLAARALLGAPGRAKDGLVCAAAAVATMALFQAAAAHRAPALLATLPAAALAAFAARRYASFA
jgi:hypothetical protein